MLFDQLNKILKPETEAEIRRAQFVRAGAVGIFGLSVLYVTLPFFFGDDTPKPVQTQGQNDKTSIESSTHHVDLNEVWRNKVEEENQTLRNQMGELMQMMQERSASGENEDAGLNRIQELEGRLLEMEMEVNSYKEAQEQASQRGGDTMDEAPEGLGSIQRFSLNLTPNQKSKKQKNVLTTIPAGAFAKTVLLSGLDASASMNASSDPRPMLLRIVDPGTLPRRFKSDLKDCHCMASAFGDLSSERIYARLEKLTCVEVKTGDIIETQVAGYIAGGDGKAGIRGTVVSKDGQFLGRSLVGGVFSGLSNVANPQNRQSQVNPFFAGNPQISAPNLGDMFTSGMATGVSSALDRLSQYYIDRAEQLQPVIQVNAGQVVDIVFTEGTTIGAGDVKTAIEKTRAASETPAKPQPQNVATAATQSEEE